MARPEFLHQRRPFAAILRAPFGPSGRIPRSLVPFQHDPVRHDAGVEVVANEPQQTTIRDSFRETTHQHVVVHAVEEGFEVDVHHPAASFLDEAPSFFGIACRRTGCGR